MWFAMPFLVALFALTSLRLWFADDDKSVPQVIGAALVPDNSMLVGQRLPTVGLIEAQSKLPATKLVQVYRDPVRARQALDGMADREGVGAAVETLASQPWRLDSVLEEERKVWLGLGVRPDRSKAYAAARLARRAAQSYLEARLRVPGPEELARMETEARARSERIADLERHLGRLPDEEALLRRTAQRASELSLERMERLTRALGREASFGLKREIRRLLERDRGLER